MRPARAGADMRGHRQAEDRRHVEIVERIHHAGEDLRAAAGAAAVDRVDVVVAIAGLDLEAEAVTQRVAEGEQPGRSGKVGGRRIGAAAGELIVLLKIAADGAADIKATLANRARRVALRRRGKGAKERRSAN